MSEIIISMRRPSKFWTYVAAAAICLLAVHVVNNRNHERRTGYEAVWHHAGFEPDPPVSDYARDCGGSTDAVRDFLQSHPCTGMRCTIMRVRDPAGDEIAVALFRVYMPNAIGAGQLAALLAKPGTGNFVPLDWSRLGLPAINLTRGHYRVEPHGSVVLFAEAEAVDGVAPAGRTLDTAAAAALRLPAQ